MKKVKKGAKKATKKTKIKKRRLPVLRWAVARSPVSAGIANFRT